MSDINFSIAYPEITWDALTVSASEASGFPVRNLFYNGSGVVWKRSGTATSTNITFDLGETKKSSANYCILRGINNVVLQQGDKYGVTVEVRASIDNFVISNVLIASQNPIELVGTKDEDAVILFDQTDFYRYWRVVIITATAIQHQLRKLFIGNLFDFNSNSPFYPYVSKYQETANAFVSDRGTLFKSSNGKKQKLIDIAWRNVLDSTRDFFQANVIERKDDSPFCFVHKDDMHNPLTVYKKPKTIADFKPVAYYKSTDVSKIFTLDSGGTLPAYGVGVGRWENAFGSAHATQATAGSRPIRSTAPIVGVRNLFNHTENLEDSFWNKARISLTNLGNGEYKIIPNTDNDTHILNTTISIVSGRSYVASASFNSAEYSVAGIRFTASGGWGSGTPGSVNVNLTNGTIISQTGIGQATIESEGDGWYRVSLKSVTTTGSGTPLVIFDGKPSTDNVFVGDGVSGVLFRKPQLETNTLTPYQRRITQHEVYEAGVPNRDYVWFDGSDDWLTANGLAAFFSGTDNPYTIIQVRRQRTLENLRTSLSIASSSAVDPSVYDYTVTGANEVRWRNRGNTGANFTDTSFGTPLVLTPQILTTSYGLSGARTYKDGAFQNLNTTPLRGATTVNWGTIGALRRLGSTSGIQFWNGDIYAILIFDKALTNADRQYVESLLSEDLQIANIQAPANTNPNLLTAWIREYEIESGVNANLNNVRLSLLEDII